MDEDRRIRFLVAPVLFLACLAWGAWLDPERPEIFSVWPKDASALLGLLAGGGVVVFAGGYILGTWNQFVLTIVFRVRHYFGWTRSQFHEVSMSDDALSRAVARLNPSVPRDLRIDELYIGAAFDFDIIKTQRPGIHDWMFRRWNAFNIGTSSIWGIYLALPFGICLGIHLTHVWVASTMVFVIIVACVARWAWLDTMNMLEFVISLPDKSNKEPDKT
jgi:hypothetical protein